MKRKIIIFIVIALTLSTALLAGGCNGKLNMVTGEWKLLSTGDGNGGNQQQPFLPMVVDIYPDGRVFFLDMLFGTYTMDRDTFTFTGADKEDNVYYSGSFKIETTTDANTGNTVPMMIIYLDSESLSCKFQKIADFDDLMAYKKAQASASAAAAAQPSPAATAAPAASAAPSAS